MFTHQDARRFKAPQKKKSRCSKLIVGEEVVLDPEHLLDVWSNHFRTLAKSTMQEGTDNSEEWVGKTEELEALSHRNEEYLFDVPFISDEVARAVHKHKRNESSGPDGLLPQSWW